MTENKTEDNSWMLKVGDKVKLLVPGSYAKQGSIGEIIEVLPATKFSRLSYKIQYQGYDNPTNNHHHAIMKINDRQ